MPLTALSFSDDGQYLGIGLPSGAIELWDVETKTRLRTMVGQSTSVGVLSWHDHLVSSGSQDGIIMHSDVRVAQHNVAEVRGHEGEVCGLKWRADGDLLASGGNDNVVHVWDVRSLTGAASSMQNAGTPRWTKRNHTAAVKALAWCPWQSGLLASGGGTGDATVHVWNTNTGARLHSLQTTAQISSIQWSPHAREFVTTHGFGTNAIMVHAYPSMEKVVEIKDAHDSRILDSALSPNGEMLCTMAGDDVLKFWKIWNTPKREQKTKAKVGSTATTKVVPKAPRVR